MTFTSAAYLAFLAAAFLIHWTLPSRARNAFLVIASYVFYCSWEWRHGPLLAGISLFNWFLGSRVLPRASTTRPLFFGIAGNLAVLVFFKYTGFLAENLGALGKLVGLPVLEIHVPEIALPLGVSFFVFQGIAYLVDVAAGEEPLGFLDFLVFKSFWAQLVAGPILRPAEMRDDIRRERVLADGDVSVGARRILVGFAKKIVLADTLAGAADAVYAPWAHPTGIDAIVGTVAFGLQVYFDFAGYSDIAFGTARLFGFHFPENFDWPYASCSPQEFWTRWHRTLSSWIRDYVHAPLAFATRNRPRLTYAWVFVAMVACGLWHGARWTFVLWGAWHGLLLVLDRTVFRAFFGARGWLALAATFFLVNVGWVLFRSASLAQAKAIFAAGSTLEGGLATSALGVRDVAIVGAVLAGHGVARLLSRVPVPELSRLRMLEAPLYAGLLLCVIAFSFASEPRLLIYFQF